jgi:hypothetical protein
MVIYRERLTPNVGIHAALLLLIPMGFGMLAPINVTWGAINAVAVYVIGELWLTLGAPRIVLTAETLRAGRATIEREFVGTATVVERGERGEALSDARAWKVIRAWIPGGVRIENNDPADPAPYWYVSSRRPQRLAELLNAR